MSRDRQQERVVHGLPALLTGFNALCSSSCLPYSVTIVQMSHLRTEDALQKPLVGPRSKVLVETAVRQINAVRQRSLSCLLVLGLQWMSGHALGLA